MRKVGFVYSSRMHKHRRGLEEACIDQLCQGNVAWHIDRVGGGPLGAERRRWKMTRRWRVSRCGRVSSSRVPGASSAP